MSLWRLAGLFLRLGAVGFGGMAALLALLHEYAVSRYRVADEDEYAEAVAIGQILPGPIVVDAATHIGFRAGGLLGAVVATLCLIGPAAVLVAALSPLYFSYSHSPLLAAALRGTGAAVVGIIFAAAWRLARRSVKDAVSVAIALLSFAALALHLLPAVWVVVLAGLAGAVLLRPQPAAKAEERS